MFESRSSGPEPFRSSAAGTGALEDRDVNVPRSRVPSAAENSTDSFVGRDGSRPYRHLTVQPTGGVSATGGVSPARAASIASRR
jgi:hypothetical protein